MKCYRALYFEMYMSDFSIESIENFDTPKYFTYVNFKQFTNVRVTMLVEP